MKNYTNESIFVCYVTNSLVSIYGTGEYGRIDRNRRFHCIREREIHWATGNCGSYNQKNVQN